LKKETESECLLVDTLERKHTMSHAIIFFRFTFCVSFFLSLLVVDGAFTHWGATASSVGPKSASVDDPLFSFCCFSAEGGNQ
jgi:hypothetical protein